MNPTQHLNQAKLQCHYSSSHCSGDGSFLPTNPEPKEAGTFLLQERLWRMFLPLFWHFIADSHEDKCVSHNCIVACSFLSLLQVVICTRSWSSFICRSLKLGETFKIRLAGALSNLIQLKMFLLIAGGLDYLGFKGPFQPTLSYDSMTLWFQDKGHFQLLHKFWVGKEGRSPRRTEGEPWGHEKRNGVARCVMG